jgi:ABC-type transport system involved in multi-copper enzyme maturation permease subunit
MNLPDVIRTIRWMVRDTLRQSLSTKLFWVMLAVTAVATLLCLSVEVQGDTPVARADYEVPAALPKAEAGRLGADKLKNDGVRVIAGEVTLGFGAVTVPIGRNREDSVRFIELWLVAAVADTVGVLLALLWTAGFLPTFLEPQAVTVLLAKPAPRWSLLVGKYLGVVLFVGLNAVLFIAGTWTALGLKTGVWYPAYWLAVPLLVLNFGVFYAVSAFLAVWTRSTVASAFGTLLFWVLCWAMNYTHHRLTAYPIEGFTQMSQLLLDVGYWTLPKPLDLGGIFYDAMRADGFAVKVEELQQVQDAGKFHPELSLLASCGFSAAVLGLAAYEFEMMDY